MTLDLQGIENETLDWRFKGCPQAAFGQRIADVGGLGLDVLRGEGPLPVAVLKRSALEHNALWMRRFLETAGARICPHGKTTMAPQLFERQLRDGAWGMTAATVAQLRVYRAHGVKRVILANQLVRAGDIEYVLGEIERDPEFDFYCLVDSVEGLARLAEVAGRSSRVRPLQVLVEVGARGGRTGVRGVEAGIALCHAVAAAAPNIALRGVEAFEGIFGGDQASLERNVGALLDDVVAVARGAESERCFAPGTVLLTAGGSAFFDLVVDRFSRAGLAATTDIVLRSGCYLTHDSHHYEDFLARMRERSATAAALGEGLRPALEIWARIQSIPEPGLAIATFGKRDASYDIDLPRPAWWFRPGSHGKPQRVEGCSVLRLNDQHAYVKLPDDHPLRVGDLMGFGISHPCTTFDKWSLLFEVDDDYRVVGAIRTFF
jgi:D-serine dehydratase